jgi:arylsulfatase A
MDCNRRQFLRLVGGASLAGSLAGFGCAAKRTETYGVGKPLARASTDKPNIIFILADDYGITGTGCYGGVYKTPHIDALAKGGVRFEYCFSMPLCAPSRAAGMMGRYGFRTGVVDNGTGGRASPQKETTIAKVLQQAGYVTAIAGKWHQLTQLATPQQGKAWGFDEFIVWDKAKGERYWKPALNRNGAMVNVAEKDYGPDLLQEFVVNFIKHHKSEPFFVYYPMVLVHGPILRTPDSAPGSTDLFTDNINYMDKLVGKLIDELEGLGLREKTAVVFVGDNGCVRGGKLNGRAIDGAKGTMKEGGSRVPLIVNWPGTAPAGQACRDLTDFTDFFPTFAELAGAMLPDGVTIDGHSFAAQVKGQPGRPRRWVYVQLGDRWYVRDNRWKLYNDGGLFDMKNSPFEEIPTSSDSSTESRDARKRLQKVLDDLRG